MICVVMGGLCRMVRDELHQTDVTCKKPTQADAQTQTDPPEEPAGPERALTSEGRRLLEGELDFLQWNKLSFEEEPETWPEVSARRGYRVSVSHSRALYCDWPAPSAIASPDKQIRRDS